MSNFLTSCCCGVCDEVCPGDGEGESCPEDSFASSYSITLGVSWEADVSGSATTASFGDDGYTYTKQGSPECKIGGGEIGSSWNFKLVNWKQPATGGFPPSYLLGDYACTIAGSCAVNESFSDENSLVGAVGGGPGGIFTWSGLSLVHEFHCETKYPYSLWYYLFNSYRVVPSLPDCFVGPGNALTCHVLAYSTPSTQCLLEPDDTLEWNLEAPARGSLAYQSKIIQAITEFVSFNFNCPSGTSCDNPGGDSGTQTNINFGLGVT